MTKGLKPISQSVKLKEEQLKEFYLLQPEQATLSDNFYFIEKQFAD